MRQRAAAAQQTGNSYKPTSHQFLFRERAYRLPPILNFGVVISRFQFLHSTVYRFLVKTVRKQWTGDVTSGHVVICHR